MIRLPLTLPSILNRRPFRYRFVRPGRLLLPPPVCCIRVDAQREPGAVRAQRKHTENISEEHSSLQCWKYSTKLLTTIPPLLPSLPQCMKSHLPRQAWTRWFIAVNMNIIKYQNGYNICIIYVKQVYSFCKLILITYFFLFTGKASCLWTVLKQPLLLHITHSYIFFLHIFPALVDSRSHMNIQFEVLFFIFACS